jgi:hypothetical protein
MDIVKYTFLNFLICRLKTYGYCEIPLKLPLYILDGLNILIISY